MRHGTTSLPRVVPTNKIHVYTTVRGISKKGDIEDCWRINCFNVTSLSFNTVVVKCKKFLETLLTEEIDRHEYLTIASLIESCRFSSKLVIQNKLR